MAAVPCGRLRGSRDGDASVSWKGIPFARPPVGELRWRPPQPPAPWDGVRDATSFAPVPWQRGKPNSSEDCLYLNVWRPSHGDGGLPVLVWLAGGTDQRQVPSIAATSGAHLAAAVDAVVVTVAYRVGHVGRLRHPALDAADDESASGNFALLDVLQALRWIRDNVDAFGGDPSNVVVAGHAAGGYHALLLLLTAAAKGLVHRVLALAPWTGTLSTADADAHGAELVERLAHAAGVSTGSRSLTHLLQSAPAADVAAAGGDGFVASCRDGAVVHELGFGAIDARTHPVKVPVIAGINVDEAKLFVARQDRRLLDEREPFLPAARAASVMRRATACDDLLRRLRSDPDQPPVWGYLFAWGALSEDVSPLPEPLSWWLGATHGMELPFFLYGGRRAVFGMGAFNPMNEPGRIALATAIEDHLRGYLHRGEPSRVDEPPVWQPWTNAPGGPKLLALGADHRLAQLAMTTSDVTVAAASAQCEALDPDARALLSPLSFGGWP